MFVLVVYTEHNEMAVVPESWLKDDGKSAVWPDFKNPAKIIKSVCAQQAPEEKWLSYTIKELYRHESYDKVRRKLKVAEVESELQTETAASEESDAENKCRRSKRKKRAPVFSDDEDEDEEPDSPVEKRRPPLPVPPPAIGLPSPKQTISTEISPIPFRNPGTEKAGTSGSVTSTPKIINRRTEQESHARDLRLFTAVEKLREQVADVKSMVQSVLQVVQNISGSVSNTDVPQDLPEDISFPCENFEAVEALECHLNDSTVYNSIVNYLSVLGGKGTPDTTRRILKHVINTETARLYNWYGKKNKLPFGQLKLASVIHRAVRKTNKSATEAEVEFITEEWLRTASDRDGGRKKREKKSGNHVPETENDEA